MNRLLKQILAVILAFHAAAAGMPAVLLAEENVPVTEEPAMQMSDAESEETETFEETEEEANAVIFEETEEIPETPAEESADQDETVIENITAPEETDEEDPAEELPAPEETEEELSPDVPAELEEFDGSELFQLNVVPTEDVSTMRITEITYDTETDDGTYTITLANEGIRISEHI